MCSISFLLALSSYPTAIKERNSSRQNSATKIYLVLLPLIIICISNISLFLHNQIRIIKGKCYCQLVFQLQCLHYALSLHLYQLISSYVFLQTLLPFMYLPTFHLSNLFCCQSVELIRHFLHTLSKITCSAPLRQKTLGWYNQKAEEHLLPDEKNFD